MTSIQSLPPLPSSLKPVSPYVQRASELKVQDPVMAYWCTYYAAQIGLDVKSQEPGAREYLFSLITLLETMKVEVGDNDAVENEDVAAAYIENFGLKVFTLADNEDRRGAATRSTAKKFLAAANFLELLEIFPKSNGVENNQEKIRYAKWKAADISKALREGRQPTPAPANIHVGETSPASSSTTLHETSAGRSKQQPKDDPSTSIPPHSPTYPQNGAAPQINVEVPQTPPRTYEHLPLGFVPTHSGLASPGSWSTAATPGRDDRYQVDVDTRDFASAAQGYGTLNDMQDVPTPSKPRQKATVSEELGGGGGSASLDSAKVPTVVNQAPPRPHVAEDLPMSTKKVHFTPSVVGGLSSTDGSPPHSPVEKVPPPPKPVELVPQAGPVPMALTYHHSHDSIASPHTIIRVSPPKGPSAFAELDRREPGSSSQPQSVPAPARSSPPTRGSPPSRSSPPSRNVPHTPGQRLHGQAGPGFAAPPILAPVPQPPPASAPSPPAVLTMAQIAKAQKHSRFAISALEYEDAEQARKELRAALKALGE